MAKFDFKSYKAHVATFVPKIKEALQRTEHKELADAVEEPENKEEQIFLRLKRSIESEKEFQRLNLAAGRLASSLELDSSYAYRGSKDIPTNLTNLAKDLGLDDEVIRRGAREYFIGYMFYPSKTQFSLRKQH